MAKKKTFRTKPRGLSEEKIKVYSGDQKILKEIRLKENLTQDELGRRLKVSGDFISMIERGERKISKKMWEKINAK